MAFYGTGDRVPLIHSLSADKIPQPYQSLLDGGRPLTSSLERFHRCTASLQLLDRSRHGNIYRRQVLLLDPYERPLSFGSICIYLDSLSSDVQAHILAGDQPVGTLLADSKVAYCNQPSALFVMIGDVAISRWLRAEPHDELYGRCNTLVARGGRPIADVVEVLPLVA
jgi:chorismate-pyruvate lyase